MNHQTWIEKFQAEMCSVALSTVVEENLTQDTFRLSFHPLTAAGIKTLQLAARCLGPTAVYCEITHYPNFALANILAHQSEILAYSVIDKDTISPSESINDFMNYLLENNLDRQVMLCQQTAAEFFQDLNDLETEDKIGLFFYDAAHDYRSQLSTLLQIRPFLADLALIVINQNHWTDAQKVTSAFSQLNPQCELCFDGTSESELLNWNGLQIIVWKQNDEKERPTIPLTVEPCLSDTMSAHLKEQQQVAQNWVQRLESCIEENYLDVALKICHLLVRWQPMNPGLWLQKTWLLFELGATDSANLAAIQTQNCAVAQNQVTILQELGLLLRRKGSFSLAKSTFLALIKLVPNDDSIYQELGFIYLIGNRFDQAAEMYQKAFSLNPSAEACYRYFVSLIDSGKIDQALQESPEAIQQFPESIRLKIKVYLALPVIYRCAEEIEQYRSRFTDQLNLLIQETLCETIEQREDAIYGLGFATNFYLGYQNLNDLDLQVKYGTWVNKILCEQYPQWCGKLPLPNFSLGQKIRVGYVSRFLYSHTISRLFFQWIIDLDRTKFEVCLYYLDCIEDSSTQQFRASCDLFKSLATDVKISADIIANDNLHILVYLDFGMDSTTTLLAALRLAPIQCLAWGHPVTSGLPSMDYFLSSELMEPKDAQKHYSEKLVLLPNLSISFPPSKILKIERSRSEILPSVNDTDIIYLSCQSLYKYLPQYDFVFPEIAQRVPQAKFVFLCHFSPHITEIFINRLELAFAALGQDYKQHCIILPRQSREDYFALNQTADIYLDTFAWSGGNTTFEAVACGLPIVTCPGEFMRGRHTYGILQMLGVTETIAEDEQGYIDIAVRLGLDPVWRQKIAEAVQQNQHKVFNDPTCLTALEAFYEQVVGKTDCMPGQATSTVLSERLDSFQ